MRNAITRITRPAAPRGKRPGRNGAARGTNRFIRIAAIAACMLAFCISQAGAAVEKTDEGIKFTYYDPDAGQVHLAGTINGWSATANPMTRDDDGYWTAVLSLGPGEHEYKFVVDGAWITDMDNPHSKTDPYGGMNSVVEIDGKGGIVTKGEALPISNTPLSARVHIGGRYLSRTSTEQGVEDDTRWRVQRPVQNVDFNFRITISEMVLGYTRMRLDSEQNPLQVNNISAILDEAYIRITPPQFTLTGYFNTEALGSDDPLELYGDIDLPGTINDDHLKFGKGTAGAVFSTGRYGLDFTGSIANVQDYDFYNDPDLYDNIGTDLINARLSGDYRMAGLGANFFFDRNLNWYNVPGAGTLPASTGIPRLNEYLDRRQDNSDWFAFEDRLYLFGPDITLHLLEDRLVPQFEYLKGEIQQGFVTGNNSGLEGGNGPIEVPLLERDIWIAHGGVKLGITDNLTINARHSRLEVIHPSTGESITWAFLFTNETEANKQLSTAFGDAPRGYNLSYSEMTLGWNMDHFGAGLWLERYLNEADMVGSPTWLYILSISPSLRWKPLKTIDLEIESQYRRYEGVIPGLELVGDALGYEIGAVDLTTYEAIVRGSFKMTNRLSAIFDIRNIYIDDDARNKARLFTAPFAGFEYKPTKKVDLVLAFGLDPLDFDIDYDGRHTGRYNFRQEYIYAGQPSRFQYHDWTRSRYLIGSPGFDPYFVADTEGIFTAEGALADKAVITLRAVFKF